MMKFVVCFVLVVLLVAPSLQQSPNSVCQLPVKDGPCKGFLHRYYYNAITGKCEPFIYGGCNGNANNFENITYCEETCPPS